MAKGIGRFKTLYADDPTLAEPITPSLPFTKGGTTLRLLGRDGDDIR